jgi:P-type Cu+ transporter
MAHVHKVARPPDHCKIKHGAHGPSLAHAPVAAAAAVVDPVCGMTVDPRTSAHNYEHDGQTYYFCTDSCRAKFATEPGRYLEPGLAPSEPPVTGVTYTCPMHPEIQQSGAGACPICGMALEPDVASGVERVWAC